MEKIIWTPRFHDNYELGIYLDRNFSKKMLNSFYLTEEQKKINDLGTKELKRFGIKYSNPYEFYKDSKLITNIRIGENANWLTAINSNICGLLYDNLENRPVEYYSHNLNDFKQTYAVVKLFSNWIESNNI